jgi:pyruvate/2-oxoglutarate/acetoin dehydrogenase E1 component/TPP-dependent pyruvate/acetoin dehydrogenase alpha subunit
MRGAIMDELKVNERSLPAAKQEIIDHYRMAYKSRQVSMVGRREALSGKAKFGIFGDGKEIIQLAIANVFQKGDFRSGYYRDQTLWFALFGEEAIRIFFAELYAHADLDAEPMTGGRQMNAHFATRLLDPNGGWKVQTDMYNFSADVSPTGSQMPRLVGLAYASRLYRELGELAEMDDFSINGNEIAFGTIGNATTAEGMFWEAVNAIGVLKAPALITIYDDGYGISVTNEYQITKSNLSELLSGFRRVPDSQEGYDFYTVRGWEYPALMETYKTAVEKIRNTHIPAIVHVIQVTQPQGHSTSGSHERYKPAERLNFEEEFDGLRRMRKWLIETGIATSEQIEAWEVEDRRLIEEIRKKAWMDYITPINKDRKEVADIIDEISSVSGHAQELKSIKDHMMTIPTPLRRDIMVTIRDALIAVRDEAIPTKKKLINWKKDQQIAAKERYSSHLYSHSEKSALKVPQVKPIYSENSPEVYGFEVLNACFDAALVRDPRVIAFGEDVGRLGDVNQGFRGLQEKYGELRVSDTGIRELTIVGQGIGMAMRGLRPIAEIQYLDYLLYALQIMSDDLATLHWRTMGGQKAPVIVRTRGHRLEGVWHSGSPMAGIINLVRGMHVLVPRNMTQAAGFYNTMLLADEPALIIEVLNAYRIHERLPDNIGEFTVPLGVPEILREGDDLTIVTYGACCKIVLEAASLLRNVGVEVEVIDVQSLLPFDVNSVILESLKKTSHIIFVDEDVPGGTTAYMLQEVIEKQGGYYWLDSPPQTISAKSHRPAYGSDGDYWSKPNIEQIFEAAYTMMNEVDPDSYPLFF